MLTYLYLFALVLGGVLLGASILLGGDHGDAGADAGVDVDADVDADAGGDAHAGGHGTMDVGGHGTPDFFLWTFRSIRFWTFFLAFFGLTGIALTWLGLVESALVGLALSVGMGLGTGFAAAAILRRLAADASGAVATSSDYVGKTARVVVPVRKGGVGKVRIQLRGTTVDVLATTDEEEDFGLRDEAMIIEMDGTRARIARVEPK